MKETPEDKFFKEITAAVEIYTRIVIQQALDKRNNTKDQIENNKNGTTD